MKTEPDYKAFTASIHSIITKITLEPDSSNRITWRGQVHQVPEAEKRSIRNLAELLFIVSRYLESWGVRTTLFLRLCRWVYARLYHRKV
jgi:hypothetical protein